MWKGLLLCALLTLLPSVCPAQAAGGTQDEEAVRKVMRQWLESFEKRDAGLRNDLLTEGTVFINAFGVEREGKESVGAFWKELFASGTFDQSKLKVTQEKVRILRPDLAVVDRFEEVTGQRGVETGQTFAAPEGPPDVHPGEDGREVAGGVLPWRRLARPGDGPVGCPRGGTRPAPNHGRPPAASPPPSKSTKGEVCEQSLNCNVRRQESPAMVEEERASRLKQASGIDNSLLGEVRALKKGGNHARCP